MSAKKLKPREVLKELFLTMIDQIYSIKLWLNKTNSSNNEASF